MIVSFIAGTTILPLSLTAQSVAPSLAWALSYKGKSTGEFAADSRTRWLDNTRLPANLSPDVLEGLSGRPDPVFVSDRSQLLEMQSQWVKRRNAACAVAADVPQCLEDAYREQYTRLMSSTPR